MLLSQPTGEIMTEKWYWEEGDRVYHAYDPKRIGTVRKIVREGQGADDVLVSFDNAVMDLWFKAHWLRRADNA